jgi:molecular chaperone IbpA
MTNRLPSLRINAASLPDFVRYVSDRTIGFENLFDHFETNHAQTFKPSGNYPPYNLIRTGEDTYEIVMAVAGFAKDQVEVRVADRELTIQSIREGDGANTTAMPTYREINRLPDGAEILHQGLAMRDFIRTFRLSEYIEVNGAILQDGILTIQLERIIPDSAKAKVIEIQ